MKKVKTSIMRLFRSICMSLVVLVFSILFIHPVTAQEPINTMWPWEIVDGGFEQWVQTSTGVWTLTNWGIAYSGSFEDQKIVSSDDRVEGSFSVMMSTNKGSGQYSQLNSGKLLDFDQGIYRLSVSVKTLGENVHGYVGFKKYIYDTNQRTWNEASQIIHRVNIAYSPDWRKMMSNIITIDKYDPNTRYMLFIYMDNDSDTVLIDDVKVERMTPISIPIPCQNKNKGDADCDGVITQKDYEIWREEFVKQPRFMQSDFNGDGRISISDFEFWRRNFFKEE